MKEYYNSTPNKEERDYFTINASKKVTIYRCGAEDLPYHNYHR
jgi:hypothetical protein